MRFGGRNSFCTRCMDDNRINICEYPIRLELGCGNNEHQRKEYLGLDWRDYGQAFVWDMTNGLPFPNDSCLEIYASHCLEHIQQLDVVHVLNECWRCLKPDGFIWVVVPHMDSPSGHILPHVTRFNEETFRSMTTERNADYKEKNERWGFRSALWETIELVTNERPDIHWKAKPIK